MIKTTLTKKPKNPIIIQGFPGFGLVSTIATEFLIDHLKTEYIGSIRVDKMDPMVAIHEGKLVQPIGVHYNSQYNIIILHVITNAKGFEWELSQEILNIAKDLKAKEIISLEGVGNPDPAQSRTFYYTNKHENRKKCESIGVELLKEGIILGVTGTLLIESEDMPVTCFFADAHSQMPDSKAAAKIIEVLDKYLGLNVDYGPLVKQAEQFEDKVKTILSKTQQAADEQEKRRMDYIS